MSDDSGRCEALELENAQYRNVIETLKKRILQSQRDMENLKREKEIADYYKSNYAALDEAYKKFKGLPENLRSRLGGIFGDGMTPQGFLAGGVQVENIDKFYDLLFEELNAGEISDIGFILREIFDFCFETANAGGREPVYERLADKKGADYDGDTMIKTTKGSRQLGSVRETRLRGYCHWRTKVVQRRSLVVVG